MLRAILTYIAEGRLYATLEISGTSERPEYHWLQMRYKDQELFIVQERSFGTLQELSVCHKKNSPLFLVVNTDKILTKILDQETQNNPEALANKAFPNLDLKTFYVEGAEFSGTNCVSIGKKVIIDDYLEELAKLGIDVFDFSLGVSASKIITNYIAANKIYTSKDEIHLLKSSVKAITPLRETPKQNKIKNTVVSNYALLGFATLIQHFSKAVRTVNFGIKSRKLAQDFRNKRQFNLLFKSTLIVLLGILLVNFTFYTYYFTELEQLRLSMVSNADNKTELQRLKEVNRSKEHMINVLDNAANSRSSFFLDQIAQKIPGTVLLDKINYQPLEKPIRPSKEIGLRKHTILISGTSVDSDVFSGWLQEMEQLNWLQKVETIDYDYVKSNTSEFLVKIELYE